jgi:FixJ family two-component response regulator
MADSKPLIVMVDSDADMVRPMTSMLDATGFATSIHRSADELLVVIRRAFDTIPASSSPSWRTRS